MTASRLPLAEFYAECVRPGAADTPRCSPRDGHCARHGTGALAIRSFFFVSCVWGVAWCHDYRSAIGEDRQHLLPRFEAVAHGERLHLNVGERACEIEGPVAQGVLALLDAVATGATVDLTKLPAELTTGQAADILGVSRPTVISLIDKGI